MNDDLDEIEVIKNMLDSNVRSKQIHDQRIAEQREWIEKHSSVSVYDKPQAVQKSEVVLSKTTRDELIEKFDNGTISKDEFQQLKTYLNTKAKSLVKNSEPESN